MTKEEIQILIQDICGRLRSGLICSIYREDDEGFGWRDAKCKGYFQNNDSYEFYFDDVITIDNIERLKPYLRPLSSMTEEEKKELSKKYVWNIWTGQIQIRYHSQGCWDDETECPTEEYIELFNWLNKKMFDYRGLISMGLALEAPEGMYSNIITK